MIYAFYSYKGGVGRTMALANIAELLYQAGLRVLMVDWDLEAPGLERFFPSIDLEEVLDRPGLIDVLLQYKGQVAQEIDDETPLEFESLEKYINNVYPDQRGPNRLLLLTAGRRSKSHFADYVRTVLTFDWQDFYITWGGELYLNWLREEFENIADVILIDSRTGVTEIGGVCTYQLADVVVMFCAPSQQNTDGLHRMLRTFKDPEVQSFRRGRPLNVLIIPARIERAESDSLDRFQEEFTGLFKEFAPETKGIDIQQLWELGIPYIPKYAYGELVAVRESGQASAEDMVKAFRGLHQVMWHLMLNQLAYEQPDQAARRLALFSKANPKDKSKQIQVASLAETFAEPLAEFQSLLAYTRGMAKHARDDLESARMQIRRAFGQSYQLAVAGVTLHLPEWALDETSPRAIGEPTLEHYIYYLRQVGSESRNAILEHRTAFETDLSMLLTHLERLSGQTIPVWEWPQEHEDLCVSQRIVRTDWLENPATGRFCFVEARIYGNVYRLQVGYSQSGRTGPEIFANLRDEAWQPSATDHLLGSSTYLCGNAADRVDELAAQAVASYTSTPSGTIISTHIAGGRVGLYGSLHHPYVTVCLYPNAKHEDWVGRTFLNDVAPRLELYKHKLDRQLAWFEENYPILSEQERSLRDLLEKINRQSLTELELLQELVQLYRVFNRNVGMVADRQTTIPINLDNLDIVLKELEPVVEDNLLSALRNLLRLRHSQLEADLRYADQIRQQTDSAINALGIKLGLDRLISLQAEPSDVALIEGTGWPGTSPLVESEMVFISPHQEPSQLVLYPAIHTGPHISLTSQEKALLQHVYRESEQVLVEKELGSGYSGARALLTLPVTAGGLSTARRVTKLGSAVELRRERDNYSQRIEDFLPFCAAQVERYYEQEGQAGLNYVFVGGGALGQVMNLEEYYRGHAAEQVIRTLDDLLDRELGRRWYSQTTPLTCFFAAEYGRHMVEHLRLRLRPMSSDALWPANQSSKAMPDYQPIGIESIHRQHEMIRPSTLLAIEGMIVREIRRSEIKLEDPGGQGIVVRVEFAPASHAAKGLNLGSLVVVRGEVIYNRRGWMEQIVRATFPDLPTGGNSECIKLPGGPGMYPNPLRVYPEVLNRVLEGRQSYVHGNLHLHNVLVDEWGKDWLIDLSQVKERHNIFDFIKLETYVRLMVLANGDLSFSLDEYAQFENALAAVTLGVDGQPFPDNDDLQIASQVILAIRYTAQKYMGQDCDFRNEYFPSLFLYCLAVTKHYQPNKPEPTQLVFITTCVLSRYILEM